MKFYLILLIFFSFLFASCGFNCESYLNEKIMPLQVDGIVIKKQKSQIGCFGDIIIKNQTGLDTLRDLCYCGMSERQELWKYVESGDSLHKSQNSLVVKVFRTQTLRTFDYPCCKQ